MLVNVIPDTQEIIIHGWSAKLFGLKLPFLHGSYMVSKAYSELYKQYKIQPLEGTFQFKSPALFNWKSGSKTKG